MKMPRGLSEIDRLIEQGLSLYGEGDLDGALVVWERALSIDPDNAQATSYVDYVKINYDLLTGDGNTEHSGPFAIDDDPEYQIEILAGDEAEPGAPAAPLFMDAHDEGWALGDEGTGAPGARGPLGAPGALGSGTLTIEADEPPGIEHPTFESGLTGESQSFEDATREYQGGAGRPARRLYGDRLSLSALVTPGAGDAGDFVPEVTPAFGSASDLQTPPGFGTEVTEMRRRDLGFVQPAEARRPAPGPPELKMTLRTPSSQTNPPLTRSPEPAPRPPEAARPPAADPPQGEIDRHRTPTAEGDTTEDRAAVAAPRRDTPSSRPAPSDSEGYASLELELTPPLDAGALDLLGRVATRQAAPTPELVAESAADTADLIMSLPTPRPASTATRQMSARPRPTEPRSPGDRAASAELPTEPAMPVPLAMGTAPTQEISLSFALQLDRAPAGAPVVAPAGAPVAAPAAAVAPPAAPVPRAAQAAPLTQAPPAASPGAGPMTRGSPDKPTLSRTPRPEDPLISAPTRDLGLRASARALSEEETTRELEVPKPRKPRGSVNPELPVMDPVDARSTELLELIDRNAPAGESREDRTRRRITALLEHAAAWTSGTDLERAVTAVDLALSEDPNSALAQKLIHRNREAILNAFQAFLGDLQRSPSLARPLHELSSAPISPRAAFLLSRVDGTLSLDEILDVSGMPRLEAYRYLCQLFLRGILR